MAAVDERRDDSPPSRGLGGIATVGVFIAAIAAIIAGAMIWLLVTDPVTTALAIESGEVTPLVRQLADILYEALVGLLEYF